MKPVLVIDDDPDARTLIEKLLKNQGYEVATASGREEAFVQLENFQPAIILLDVLLSGFDGREVCREIRQKSGFEAVPVIMISAHPGATENYLSYGANDFITKPIRSESLVELIKRYIH